MSASRDDQAEAVLVGAARLVETAQVAGWSPQAALDTVDVLAESLGRLGAPAAAALAPVMEATGALRALIAAVPGPAPAPHGTEHAGPGTARTAVPGRPGQRERTADTPSVVRARPAPSPRKQPGEEWLTRDPARAEREYIDAHRHLLGRPESTPADPGGRGLGHRRH